MLQEWYTHPAGCTCQPCCLAEVRARARLRPVRHVFVPAAPDPLKSVRDALLEPLGLLRESDFPSYSDTPHGCCTRCHLGPELGTGLCVYCLLADETRRKDVDMPWWRVKAELMQWRFGLTVAAITFAVVWLLLFAGVGLS